MCGAGRCPLNPHRLLYPQLPRSANLILDENILKVWIAHCLSILVVGLPEVVHPFGCTSACWWAQLACDCWSWGICKWRHTGSATSPSLFTKFLAAGCLNICLTNTFPAVSDYRKFSLTNPPKWIILFSVVNGISQSPLTTIFCVWCKLIFSPCCNQHAPPCSVQLPRQYPQDADVCILLIQKSWGYQEAVWIITLHTCLAPFIWESEIVWLTFISLLLVPAGVCYSSFCSLESWDTG